MRLLLSSVVIFCLSEYAFSRPWCRGGRYDPVKKKCVYDTPRPRPRPRPAPVCPSGYRWNGAEGRCVRADRPSPAPQPNPERRGDARVFETTYYMSEAASVTVTSVHDGVEYQKAVKGTAYVLVKHRVGEFHDKLFDNVAEMKSYLLEHACQLDSTEGALAFKSAEDAKGASMQVLLAEKGSLSSAAKVHIEVRYLHGPPSGRGQAYMRNLRLDCP